MSTKRREFCPFSSTKSFILLQAKTADCAQLTVDQIEVCKLDPLVKACGLCLLQKIKVNSKRGNGENETESKTNVCVFAPFQRPGHTEQLVHTGSLLAFSQ